MEDFTFDELIGDIKDAFEEFSTSMLKRGENYLQVLARFYVEYDNVMDAGICENAIIAATLCMELEKVGQKSIFKSQYKRLMDAFNVYSPSKVAGEISPEEVEELTRMVAKALDYFTTYESSVSLSSFGGFFYCLITHPPPSLFNRRRSECGGFLHRRP